MHLQAIPGASTDAFIVEDDFDIRTTLRQLVEDTGDSCSEAEVDLPPAIRGQLLDPAIWQHGLEQFALATNLAVALVGADGSLLGRCLNPQPTWSLLRTKRPAGIGACPFSLRSLKPCSCIADALKRRDLVMARDRTGLVHITVPLVLGGQHLGALIAGQVFDHYAEQLPLEQVAKKFGLSPSKVWEKARRERPISRATLQVYGDLLATLGNTFLQTRYNTILEAERSAEEAKRLAEMTRLRDLLEQRTEELAQADRFKDEFLGMLAHELRNPLGAMRNAVAILRLPSTPATSAARARDMLERQVKHLARLVDDLLDVARISRGKILLCRERLDLLQLVHAAVEDHRGALEASGLSLELETPAGPFVVVGDPTRLTQVMGNLLHNAGKFTNSGGRVTVQLAVEADGGRVAVSISDTGLGIEADMLLRVFEKFAQADCSSERGQGGLGLGLALVKVLVELHGGEVRGTSEGLGHGTKFTISLPLEPEQAAPVEVMATERCGGGRCRILVVEDNRDAADSLRILLELFGHEVAVAYSGPEGVKVARQFRPDVVLSDLGLPGMDGYAVATALRQDPATAKAQVIAVSGYAGEEDQRRCREAGFNQHLTKPVDPEELRRLLPARLAGV